LGKKRYQVFLSHNSADKPAVERLAEQLLAEGIQPFLDKWNLVPGEPRQEGLEEALDESETCAVFLGPHGPGTWENEEMRVALDHRVRGRLLRVIPVLLPSTTMPRSGELPAFLSRLTWVDFRAELDDAEAFWRLLCGIRGEAPGPSRSWGAAGTPAPSSRQPRPPYPGLTPFTTDDAKFFHGRDALTRRLVACLHGERLLVIGGRSGTGKSSLIHAGLLPAIDKGEVPGSETWTIVHSRPGNDPLRRLMFALSKRFPDDELDLERFDALPEAMQADAQALANEIKRLSPSHILMIADQCEQVFDSRVPVAICRAFFANLAKASDSAQANATVVLVVRNDFLESVLDICRHFYASAEIRPLIVHPMSEDETWEAITTPAQQTNLIFEGALDSIIMKEMKTPNLALPLLQRALRELWEQRKGNVLTIKSYTDMKGVAGSIARWAESIYSTLNLGEQELARRILLKLVQPGRKAENDIRRRIRLDELNIKPEYSFKVESVVTFLIKRSILIADIDESSKDHRVVEIAHDALLHSWPRFQQWLADSRNSMIAQDRLRERADAWREFDEDSGSLLRGKELAYFEKWSCRETDEVNPALRDYLDRSLENRRIEAGEHKVLMELLPERAKVHDRVDSDNRQVIPFGVPLRQWQPNLDPPGALLRAQFGVVPFHGREKELQDLHNWCHSAARVAIRLYTAAGGAGKTRLALELALQLRNGGWWTGFVTAEGLRYPERMMPALARPGGKVLLVVDYAEVQNPFLIFLLRELYQIDRGPIRLLLLARAALDWWKQLKSEPGGVGGLLSGPATSRHALAPFIDSPQARADSYRVAAQAFAAQLQAAVPTAVPDDLDAHYYQKPLLLHMRALIDLEGENTVRSGEGILDRILHRERRYWETRAADHGLPAEISPGIGRAMAAITMGGGINSEAEAVKMLRSMRFFADQPAAVLTAVARLLHEAYPGERWIEPVQPDLLGEHLVQRELEDGADELFDLVLGPKSGG